MQGVEALRMFIADISVFFVEYILGDDMSQYQDSCLFHNHHHIFQKYKQFSYKYFQPQSLTLSLLHEEKLNWIMHFIGRIHILVDI